MMNTLPFSLQQVINPTCLTPGGFLVLSASLTWGVPPGGPYMLLWTLSETRQWDGVWRPARSLSSWQVGPIRVVCERVINTRRWSSYRRVHQWCPGKVSPWKGLCQRMASNTWKVRGSIAYKMAGYHCPVLTQQRDKITVFNGQRLLWVPRASLVISCRWRTDSWGARR